MFNNIQCLICSADGNLLYSKLKDKLFLSSGSWDLYRCSNTQCKHIWIYPQPTREELELAYKTYYTHRPNHSPKLRSKLLTILHNILVLLREKGVNNKKYRDKAYMYLADDMPGSLLDIGCGNGDLLLKLREIGWTVEGQEIDPVSADIAKAKNLKIYSDDIIDLNQDHQYDAITMSHVIEHLSSPAEVLSKCYTMLKIGGKLVITTPNSNSLGHGLFKRNWRGLEVPRHLNIFSCANITALLNNMGFSKVRSLTTSVSADSVFFDSMFLLFNMSPYNHKAANLTKYLIRFLSICYQITCTLLCRMFKCKGEECVIIAIK